MENKEGWKTVIDKIAREEANEWYCEEMNASGLLSKKDRYRRIREAEADERVLTYEDRRAIQERAERMIAKYGEDDYGENY